MSDFELFVVVAFGLGIVAGVAICDAAVRINDWRMRRRIRRYRKILWRNYE